MNRDEKLREVVQEMRDRLVEHMGDPDGVIIAWADRIESALGEPVVPIPAELKESLDYMDEERKSCGHRHMHLYTKDFDALRAWIRQVTGE